MSKKIAPQVGKWKTKNSFSLSFSSGPLTAVKTPRRFLCVCVCVSVCECVFVWVCVSVLSCECVCHALPTEDKYYVIRKKKKKKIHGILSTNKVENCLSGSSWPKFLKKIHENTPKDAQKTRKFDSNNFHRHN